MSGYGFSGRNAGTVDRITELIHNWAHGRASGKRVGNVSVSADGTCLFSYALCIGRIISLGHSVIIHHSDSTSTTNKHISKMRGAISHYEEMYYCFTNLCPNRGARFTWDSFISSELEKHKLAIESTFKKAAKARSNKYWLVNNAIGLQNAMIALIDLVDRIQPALLIRQNVNVISAMDSFLKKTEDIEALLILVNEGEKARIKKEQDAIREVVEWWKQGGKVTVPWTSELAYLRLVMNTDAWGMPEAVETSKGIVFSVVDAHRLLLAFNHGRLLGQEIKGFKITQVDSERELIVAGCHSIPFSEVRRLEPDILRLAISSKT